MTNDQYERDPGQEVPRQRLGLIDFATQNVEMSVAYMTPVTESQPVIEPKLMAEMRRQNVAAGVSTLNIKGNQVAQAQVEVANALDAKNAQSTQQPTDTNQRKVA